MQELQFWMVLGYCLVLFQALLPLPLILVMERFICQQERRLGFLDFKNIKEVKFDPKHTSLASLERIIKDQTGCEVKFDQDNIKLTKLKSLNEMKEQFAKAESGN